MTPETLALLERAINNVSIHTHAGNGMVNRQKLAASLLANADLRAVLDAGQRERWIPVTERVPEQWTTVLVAVDFGKHGGTRGVRFDVISDEGKWTQTDGDYITHWKPLPALPELVAAPAPPDGSTEAEGTRNGATPMSPFREHAERFSGFVLQLLRNTPWPTPDARWQIVESWAKELHAACLPATPATPAADASPLACPTCGKPSTLYRTTDGVVVECESRGQCLRVTRPTIAEAVAKWNEFAAPAPPDGSTEAEEKGETNVPTHIDILRACNADNAAKPPAYFGNDPNDSRNARCTCGHLRGQHCNGECCIANCPCYTFTPVATPATPAGMRNCDAANGCQAPECGPAPADHPEGCAEFAAPAPGTPAGADNPDADGTDFAHPAWWRGNDAAVHRLCRVVNDTLDGKDDGKGVANEPWESTRRRLLAAAPSHAALAEQVRAIPMAAWVKDYFPRLAWEQAIAAAARLVAGEQKP